MTTHPAIERLSACVDDDLPADERATIEEHLAECAECRAALEDLRGIVEGARMLEDRPPETDLWPGIAAAISGGGTAARARSWSWVGALAAGLLLALTSSLAIWVVLSGRVESSAASAGGTPVAPAIDRQPLAILPVALSSDRYRAAADDLMRVIEDRRDQLDPKTVAIVERNIATIDRAIAETMAALAEQPDDPGLVAHVTDQQQLKLSLLRQVERLTVRER